MLQIEDYSPKYKPQIMEALFELQKHEYSLSDTRKRASNKVCEKYFDEMLHATQDQDGAILVCLQKKQFTGFVCYRMESEENAIEQKNSTHHALISDVCVLAKYRGQGIAQRLFDAVFDNLCAKRFKGRVRICALANNELAARAYDLYGFEPYEITFQKWVTV